MTKPSKQNINYGAPGLTILVGLLIFGFFFLNSALNYDRDEKIKPIAAAIKASQRPKLIEFYAEWCGPCKRYGPIVEECRTKYSDKVDFERLDVDDPKNSKMTEMFNVSAIPMTCIFDRNGKRVAFFTGPVGLSKLDGYMEQVTKPAN